MQSSERSISIIAENNIYGYPAHDTVIDVHPSGRQRRQRAAFDGPRTRRIQNIRMYGPTTNDTRKQVKREITKCPTAR